jgi:hypothetical protein
MKTSRRVREIEQIIRENPRSYWSSPDLQRELRELLASLHGGEHDAQLSENGEAFDIGWSFLIWIDRYRKSVQNHFISRRIGVAMNWDIQLARPLRMQRCGLPEVVRTLGDAIDLIDEHLPETLRFQPAWREVKEVLVIAAETRTGLAVDTATTLLEHVLEDEGWLVPLKAWLSVSDYGWVLSRDFKSAV